MLSFFERNRRPSGIVRAVQISEYLGAKLNPISGYENDVCIYVRHVPDKIVSGRTYIDMIDDRSCAQWVTEHPEAKLIVSTKVLQRYLDRKYKIKDTVLIPHHHCNYLREKRISQEVRVAGIIGGGSEIGGGSACEYNIDLLREELRKMDVELIYFYKPRFRKTVVEFYKAIDVQIIFRPRRASSSTGNVLTPLKLENASSFGVPTVSFPEPSFVEFGECFLYALSIEDIIQGVWDLKNDRALYENLSELAREKADKYHIEYIGELYKQLDKEETNETVSGDTLT
jgi:hypothetical protein